MAFCVIVSDVAVYIFPEGDSEEDDDIPSYDITENIYLAPTVKYIDLDEK